jgi:glutathione synthase/RimK-type ligase-like ATP-grasp enzyme
MEEAERQSNQGFVIVGKKTKRSGRLLASKLRERGFQGQINWGNHAPMRRYSGTFLNEPSAVMLASNKKKALYALQEAQLPVPDLMSLGDAQDVVHRVHPIVARTTYHSKGRGFWLCWDMGELSRAAREGATHFMPFIENAREFRVHIVNGDCIKISEKILPEDSDEVVKNVRSGAVCVYPHDFRRKGDLREISKKAVECLGLDFGAVDILVTGYRDPDVDTRFYVLEVNTAPCLTDENSDTLDRYVAAFMGEDYE